MLYVTLLGAGSFVLVSLAVGLRLLRLAQRTRQLPELAMGAAFFLNGGLGYLLSVASGLIADHAELLQGASSLLGAIGCAGLALFNWKVFRPDATGRALFAVICVGLTAGFFGRLATVGFTPGEFGGFFPWVGLLTRTSVFAWASCEAVVNLRMSRRRMALGLTTPDTVNRFFWWSVGATAATGIFLHAIARITMGLSLGPTEPGSAIPIAVGGLVAAGAIWRAFRVTGQGEAAQATA